MAIIHRTYFFDPVIFHAELKKKLIDHNQLRLDILLDLAKTVVANATETTWQILESLRFDNEWFDISDEDISRTHCWYLVTLTEMLTPAPSLSRYGILRRILPFVGWTETRIRLLIQGQQLHTLVESSGNSLFIAEFVGVDPYGGWLSLKDAESLLSDLLTIEKQFTIPSRELMEALPDATELHLQSPLEMINRAYNEAREMLQMAIDRNNALFIILD